MTLLFYICGKKNNKILEKELDEERQLKEIWEICPNYLNRLNVFYIHNHCLSETMSTQYPAWSSLWL